MKSLFKKNIITASLLIAGVLSGSASFAAANDAASVFPDISGKKIMVGFWHNWASKSDGYQQGSAADVELTSIPAEYNVITVAFMEGSGIPTFKPYNMTDAQFRQAVATLNSQGRAVLVSLGGADAHIELKAGDAQKFADEIIRLVELYGFDGLDIDLEGSAIKAGANQTEIPAALKLVKNKYPHFIISMAPEFPYLRNGGAYEGLIKNLEGYYDFISPQYYNQGGDGVAAGSGWYAQNDDSKKAEFLYYLTDSLVHGSRDFIRIPADKFVIGLPSNPDAAATGYARNEADVRSAWERLTAQGTPIKGLMTWSINWDTGHSKAGNAYGYEFANRYGKLINEDFVGEPDNQAPSQPGKPELIASSGLVALSWTPSTDNVGVAQYQIWRNGEEIGQSTSPQFSDNQVTNGNAYEYVIIAVDKAGNLSLPSEAASVVLDDDKPSEDNEQPSTPQGLYGEASGAHAVKLSWEASSDNVAVRHYNIYRNGALLTKQLQTSFIDTGLAAGTSYQYQVEAVDTSDNHSDKSEMISVTTEAGENPQPGYPAYVAGTAYKAGDKVSSAGGVYACKPWPYTAWCAGAEWAYAPGTGSSWAQAWDKK
ncbi:glycosyl hydrolase family 18 protein [Winslowiella toletana]|uniref:glycosyl hydrolase family 18 protein n=1 Tax=Winslowiella toletana TaxID=92490 RepID=UPI0028BDF6BF|nr:glycosyl hydrolase family 18 protein [Winslowiella toletana]WNN45067.1 glycosyl hydrolase family 18 protein [Winslowiella toletana]